MFTRGCSDVLLLRKQSEANSPFSDILHTERKPTRHHRLTEMYGERLEGSGTLRHRLQLHVPEPRRSRKHETVTCTSLIIMQRPCCVSS